MALTPKRKRETTANPPSPVLERLGVERIVRYLGGRVNRHWLAVRRGTIVVLKCHTNESQASIAFETEVREHMARRGWAVPLEVGEAVLHEGRTWQAFCRLPGRTRAPRTIEGHQREQRQRGRLLARLHADLSDLHIRQRDGWVKRDEVLALDPPTDDLLRQWQRRLPVETNVLKTYATCAREAIETAPAPKVRPIVIHGDVARWNLLFSGGRLSGLLDWEMSHIDHGVADFAFSWRGHYDDVILGYEDVTPLEPAERALIRPYYWLSVLENARAVLLRGSHPEPQLHWHVESLLRSSREPYAERAR